MSLPQTIDPHGDPCDLVERWTLEQELADRLTLMAGMVPFPIQIFSGFRTAAEQDQLREEGRPAAPNELSNHLACPSRAADVKPQIAAVPMVIAQLGSAAVHAGLRWGGGSPVDPETGIPSDWQHVDLGPRHP